MSGNHDPALVLLSIAIAVLASYSALNLATQVGRSRAASRRAWLAGGAVVMGTGIWAMHFVGMLALAMPVPVGYAVPETALSWVIAVAVSTLALHLGCRRGVGARTLAGGGVVMGVGICLMHYTGMAAMHMSPPPRYDPLLFLASVLIAIAASTAALWIAGRLAAVRAPYMRLGAAVVMGVAIAGMHYTGMAAVRFAPDSVCLSVGAANPARLGLIVSALTVILVLLALVVAYIDTRADARMARMSLKLQAANEELLRVALHDPLTGLPNRLLLQERMGMAFALARRERGQLALLLVGLDGLKLLNDTLGHARGDDVLREVARRLRGVLRESDILARVGGDEFVLLLQACEHREAVVLVAERVLEAVRRPLQTHGEEIAPSASIGIAMFPEDGDEQRLLTAADLAMHEAKRAGRATWRCYSADMERGAQEAVVLQRELRQALGRGEFVLYYQPKVCARTGQIAGVEALIRWQHPEHGLHPPGAFIPLAERVGLIDAIGDWVLEAACAQLARWQAAGLDLRVACNLSPRQFRQPGLADKVIAALRRHGIAPGRLVLEITESSAMEEPEQARAVMARLAREGVSFAIDDFGTGYSCLASLRDLPVGELKIDRSFVAALDDTPRAKAIIEAVVRLAQALEMAVVAEGVETAEQARLLVELGCDVQQGFLHARPLPLAALEALFAQRRGREAA